MLKGEVSGRKLLNYTLNKNDFVKQETPLNIQIE